MNRPQMSLNAWGVTVAEHVEREVAESGPIRPELSEALVNLARTLRTLARLADRGAPEIQTALRLERLAANTVLGGDAAPSVPVEGSQTTN